MCNVPVIDLVCLHCLWQYGEDYFKRSCDDCFCCFCHIFGIGGHGDRSTKLFGGHKRCCDSQWPLTGCYFKCWWSDSHTSLTLCCTRKSLLGKLANMWSIMVELLQWHILEFQIFYRVVVFFDVTKNDFLEVKYNM